MKIVIMVFKKKQVPDHLLKIQTTKGEFKKL